ncbi:Protein CBP3, mitochondrial [Lachnellula hyalina]|uniref:Protein CBP3, mitochondrial n=1 Tax=Lachnellula hyalina TaxID=1316788 RepID=A0A8H8QV72_9HELO|nr:Protein CBP3, mitochondrial [Lachnellula hyalina]TVY23413.1 Protein CBP3, mitochondrial [Lachnellula hyalina]
MASKTCVSCLRILQRQSRFVTRTQTPATRFTTPSRAFTTTHKRFAILDPDQDNPTTPNTSIPPVTPKHTKQGTITANGSTVTDSPAVAAAKAPSPSYPKGGVIGTYTAYGATEELYKECARHADYTIPQAQDSDSEMPKTEDGEDLGVGEGWWHTETGLNPTFSTWSQVTMLHVYLLTVRFRCFDPSIARVWQQHILDHFFFDAENKMVLNHGMNARGTRNKYLKDLFIQWRGVLAAYDEGIAKDDAVLASAVWRNVFKASENVDIKRLAQIVSYMRRVLAGLDSADDETVMKAMMTFGSPESEGGLVAFKSKMMDTPFENAPPTRLPAKEQK